MQFLEKEHIRDYCYGIVFDLDDACTTRCVNLSNYKQTKVPGERVPFITKRNK